MTQATNYQSRDHALVGIYQGNFAERYRQTMLLAERERDAMRFLNAYDSACGEFVMLKEYTG